MGSVLITLLIIGITLTAFFWAITVFLQGYWYTEASTAVFWQAPAAGASVTLFYLLWAVINANAEGATPVNVPYTTIFSFSNKVEKYPKPVERLTAIKRTGERVNYRRTTVNTIAGTQYQYKVEYKDKSLGNILSDDGIVGFELDEGGQKVQYKLEKGDDGRRFVSEDGWIVEDSSPGSPFATSTGLLLANWLLNIAHFGIWVVCFWLLLRFQLSHAIGLSVVTWLVTSLFVLPFLLGQAGAVAQESAPPRRAAQATHITSPASLAGRVRRVAQQLLEPRA